MKSSGELNEVICKDGGVLKEVYKAEGWGQIALRTIGPGETVGGHRHPNTSELWLVMRGEALVRLEFKGGARAQLWVSGDAARPIEVPAGTGHDLTNVGEEEIVLVFRADRVWEGPDKEEWAWRGK